MQPSLTFWLILGILAVLIYVLVVPKIGHGRNFPHMSAQTDIRGGIKAALDAYRMDNGFYPKSLNNLIQQSSDAKNWRGPYFDPPKVPIDPWGDNYIYEFPGKHNTNGYDLFSAGPDGKEGTKDDIGNWPTQ